MPEGGFSAGSIVAKLFLDKTGWNQSVAAIKKDTDSLAANAKRLGKDLEEVGLKLQSLGKQGMIAGAAILGGLGLAVKGFADFDAAMTESLAIMGDLSDGLRTDLANAAKQVSRETTISATEAAKAYYFLASAGYSATESVKTMPVVAKFAQAGMFNLERATSLLADAQSALGMRIRNDAVANMQNMVRVADVLSKANIMANASIEQFSESLTTRAGAALRLVGKDVEEGTAVLAAFADQGVKGAEAGTRLDIVLRDLQTRALKNADVFKKYQVAVFDSNGEMNNMADIIGDLEKALAGKSDAQKRSILMEMEFADRSVASILNLVGMSDAIRNYEKELRKAGGTTEEIAGKQLETLKSQVALTKNSISLLGDEIGASLAPSLEGLTIKIRGVVDRITEWVEKHPGLTKALTLTAASIGGLLLVGGSTIFMLGSFLRSLSAIIQALPILRAGLLIVKGQIAALGQPLSFSSGLLTKIGLIGAAAFIGWNIGKIIGDITGLNTVIENASTKIIDKFGLWKGSAELVASSTDRVAKQQDLMKQATEKAGIAVTNYMDAVKVMNGTMVVQDGHLVRISAGTKDVADKTKGLKGEMDDLGPTIGDANAAAEKWNDTLKALGIESLGNVTAKTTELLETERKVQALYDDKKISTAEYSSAIKNLSEELGKLGATTKIQVLPPARDLGNVLDDIKPKIGDLGPVLDDVYYGFLDQETMIRSWSAELGIGTDKIAELLIPLQNLQILLATGMAVGPLDFSGWVEKPGGIKSTTKSMTDIFAGGMNDIARAFGDTFSKFIEEGFNFKTLWDGLWTSIKDSFFRILGEMATKFVTDFLGGLVKNAAKAAGDAASSITSTATSAVKGITDVLSGGLATAIGSFAGNFLAGILGGGPSGHQQQQAINDQKDSRNFLADIKNWLYSAGSGFGGAIWDFGIKFQMEKFDGLKASVDLSRDSLNPKVDEANGWLRSIDGRGGDIARAIGDLKSAAGGAVSTTTELVAVHGTPANPEYILPAQDLSRIVSAGPASGGAASLRDISVNVIVSGQIITDREYTRARLIPEIIQAAKSGLKGELQAALGVA